MPPSKTANTQSISARKVITISLLVDLLDVVGNLIVAVLSGSIIMVTETLEGVSDLTSTILLLVGYNKSKQLSNKSHPFGYGRELYFWSLLAALVMFAVTATFSIYFGFMRFLHPTEIHNLHLAYIILIVGMITNGYAFLLSSRRLLRSRSIGRIIQIFYRSSLIETKTTFILDLMGTSAAVFGFIALVTYQLTGNSRLDGIGSMVIGVVLGGLSYTLVMGIRDLVVGRSASPEVEEKIKLATRRIPNVRDVLGLKTLHIGSERLLVNLDVHLKSTLTTREIEKLIDVIKEEVRREVPAVKHIQVELETPTESQDK